jgi:UDPglucose--hexose-1-phosphate uridylyltransferase
MPPSTWLQVPHRRFNPLTREWVLVSPHRTQRPWQGEVARTESAPAIHYDPTCYLCPGNTRVGGHQNPKYKDVFVFDNDYAALLPDIAPFTDAPHDDLFWAERELGICRVICFHPDHDLTLARMQPPDIERVVEAWAAQIFENRGPMMGASNPHPHCQVWSTEHIPDEPLVEQAAQLAYLDSHGSCMLCDTVAREVQLAQRIVCENQEFVALVPFWAVWPFETLLLSRRHCGALTEMDVAQRAGLADMLKQVTTRYDNLFQTSFPYTMGFHQSPTDSKSHPEWHFHAHFYPPLLRSATIRKFMVGFEMLGMPQRDITPESAAERLRAVSDRHYTLEK